MHPGRNYGLGTSFQRPLDLFQALAWELDSMALPECNLGNMGLVRGPAKKGEAGGEQPAARERGTQPSLRISL